MSPEDLSREQQSLKDTLIKLKIHDSHTAQQVQGPEAVSFHVEEYFQTLSILTVSQRWVGQWVKIY